jgi:hypothetical protein
LRTAKYSAKGRVDSGSKIDLLSQDNGVLTNRILQNNNNLPYDPQYDRKTDIEIELDGVSNKYSLNDVKDIFLRNTEDIEIKKYVIPLGTFSYRCSLKYDGISGSTSWLGYEKEALERAKLRGIDEKHGKVRLKLVPTNIYLDRMDYLMQVKGDPHLLVPIESFKASSHFTIVVYPWMDLDLSDYLKANPLKSPLIYKHQILIKFSREILEGAHVLHEKNISKLIKIILSIIFKIKFNLQLIAALKLKTSSYRTVKKDRLQN